MAIELVFGKGKTKMNIKLLIMIADNIKAVDVTNENDIDPRTFDGMISMPITDDRSLDKAIELIRDGYNVNTFESDTDVMIVYDKLSSQMINRFAASFNGCNKIGVIPILNLIPVIIRNKGRGLPIKVTFDGRTYPFLGNIADEQNIPSIDLELNDFFFLFRVNPDFFDELSKKENIKLQNRFDKLQNEYSSYKEEVKKFAEQVKELTAKATEMETEISLKNEEINRLKLTLESCQAQINAKNANDQLLSERSIVYVDIPNNIWDALTDWNRNNSKHAHLYLYAPRLSGAITTGMSIATLFWSFFHLEAEQIIKLQQIDIKNSYWAYLYNIRLSINFPDVNDITLDDKKRNYLNDRRVNIKKDYLTANFIVLDCEIKAARNGKIFRLIRETDEITEKRQAIAVIGNMNDSSDDIDRWLAAVGKNDLKCV